ncbi:hypothetical protein FZC74_10845 [Sutcliffiella horikoshii]|uniref:Uncharacterized protein n=1 Tax=Sutcliffiella horikoshii TaxID=79883 RepID=A0AA95B6A3_9BACI|nr:hypothetical protein [Sutcliffiella horikoshii]TYS59224.1 hypothetical protein FZC74_10845 [Sutcliffiella horikoshii]
MEWIFDILQQAPWLIFVLLGIFSTLFKGGKQEEQQKKQQQQRQQQRQRQQTATQASQRQEDYEDYRRESAPAPKREDKPRFDWDIDIFGEGKLEELEQKVREKVNPYLEKVEKKKEQVTTIQQQMKDEVKELSIKGQEISKDSPILKQELQLSEGKVVSSRHRIKPNRVVEGVMWSEILGQPRSRNPHRPVYTEHFSKRK